MALFDTRGRILPKVKRYPDWGCELDEGGLFFIEKLQLEKPFRHMGLAKYFLSLVMDSADADLASYFYST